MLNVVDPEVFVIVIVLNASMWRIGPIYELFPKAAPPTEKPICGVADNVPEITVTPSAITDIPASEPVDARRESRVSLIFLPPVDVSVAIVPLEPLTIDRMPLHDVALNSPLGNNESAEISAILVCYQCC